MIKLKSATLGLIVLLVSCTSRFYKRNEEVTTPTGLRYSILKNGKGAKVKEGQEVLIYETVSYLSGTNLYSTRDMGTPIKVKVGGQQVIKGVDEGLIGMKAGELRKLIVPALLSKRTEYPPFLSPDSTLVYKIELVEIVK